jgi:hypothetical protein
VLIGDFDVPGFDWKKVSNLPTASYS